MHTPFGPTLFHADDSRPYALKSTALAIADRPVPSGSSAPPSSFAANAGGAATYSSLTTSHFSSSGSAASLDALSDTSAYSHYSTPAPAGGGLGLGVPSVPLYGSATTGGMNNPAFDAVPAPSAYFSSASKPLPQARGTLFSARRRTACLFVLILTGVLPRVFACVDFDSPALSGIDLGYPQTN